jgi:two-component system response regulator HydG
MDNFAKGRSVRVEPETLDEMMRYSWPGNVRELEHSIERAIALAGGSEVLRREHILGTKPVPERKPAAGRVCNIAEAVAEAEKAAIRAALDHTRGRKAEAAQAYGME